MTAMPAPYPRRDDAFDLDEIALPRETGPAHEYVRGLAHARQQMAVIGQCRKCGELFNVELSPIGERRFADVKIPASASGAAPRYYTLTPSPWHRLSLDKRALIHKPESINGTTVCKGHVALLIGSHPVPLLDDDEQRQIQEPHELHTIRLKPRNP